MNEPVNSWRQSAAVLAALGLARDRISHDSLDDFFKIPSATIGCHGLDCKGRILFAALEIVSSVLRWDVIPIPCRAGMWMAAFHRDERQTHDGRPERAAKFFGCPIAGFKVWPNHTGGQRGCFRAMCHEPFDGLNDIGGWQHWSLRCLDGT